MRTFIAVNLPEEIKDELYELQQELKKSITSEFIKWDKKENLHITLLFLGELGNDKFNHLVKALDAVSVDAEEIKLNITAADRFSNRIIYAAAEDKTGAITKLANEIRSVCYDFGYTDTKDFKPHITLARVKDRRGKFILPEVNTNIEFTVKSFELMKSTLTPKGSIYTPVKSFKLKYSIL